LQFERPMLPWQALNLLKKRQQRQQQAASRVQSAAKAGPAGRSAAARLRDLLDEQEAASRGGGVAGSGALLQGQPATAAAATAAFDAAELDAALARLAACRAASASAAADADLRLLLQFLRHARARKQSRLEQLRGELDAVEADLALVSACGGGVGARKAETSSATALDAATAANLLSAPATVPSLEDRTPGASPPGSDFETAPAVPALGGGAGSERLLLTSSGGGGAATTTTTTATTATTTVEEGGSGSGRRRTRRSARAAAAAAATAFTDQQAIVVVRGGKEKQSATPAEAAAAAAPATENQNQNQNTALALFDPTATHRARKRRVAAQFDSLQECYLSLRREREGEVAAASGSEAGASKGALPSSVDAVAASAVSEMLNPNASSSVAVAGAASSSPCAGGLAEFSRLLSTFVRCSELEVLARLPATGGAAVVQPSSSSAQTPRSIISSLDFDASGRWLAAAAVAKRVSVFDFEQVLRAGSAERRWRERREEQEEEEDYDDEEQEERRRRRSVRGAAGSDSALPPQPPRPVFELTTRSKLSCAVWAKTRTESSAGRRDANGEENVETGDDEEEELPRPSPPPLLVSTDYCGCATVWDCTTSRPVAEYDAHDRRAWSADWSPANGGSSVFATASDDGTAKIWALNVNPNSSNSPSPNGNEIPSSTSASTPVVTLDVRANVCSAAFDPSDPSGNTLALGAADHAVRVYDLRHTSTPLHVLSGHKKAASYVRWGAGGLVSASTDSTLRLWPLPKRSNSSSNVSPPPPPAPLLVRPPRVFKGHVNERNFVGLAADPRHDLLAAGSETGEVVVWHASMARPVAKARVSSGGIGGVGGSGAQSDGAAATPRAAAAAAAGSPPPPFVSAVAWRPLPDHLVPPSKETSLHDVESATYTLVAANAHGALQVMRLGGGGGGARAKAAAAAKRRRREQERGFGAEGGDDDQDDGFDDEDA